MIAFALHFGQPIWLLLILPLAVSLLFWRLPSRLLTAIRAVAVFLIVVALALPYLMLPSKSGTIVVVADRSRSMPALSTKKHEEAIELIYNGRPGREDQLAVVSFGAEAQVDRAPSGREVGALTSLPNADGSNLADALASAVSLIPRDTPGRIIVLSDGRWTGADPMAEAAEAAVRDIAIDYRLMERPRSGDVAIRSLEMPDAVTPGEAYSITGWIDVPTAREIKYEFRRDGTLLASGTRSFDAGRHRLTFRDQAETPGNYAYQLHVTSSMEDPVAENNTARRLLGIDGPRPILLVTPKEPSAFGQLLVDGGLEVDVRTPEQCEWSVEELTRYSAVVVENVMASDIGLDPMNMLAIWVREMGGGFMMTGGKNAYSNGGYYESPIEPILPVSLELRQEHRKMSLAMVIALDRSGSMAMPASGSRTKMDLANLGAAEVVKLLTSKDEIGVLAVDSAPHEIVGMTRVENPDAIQRKILTIDSGGGGIFVNAALVEAVRMLQKADAETKHIILFSDAADTENDPGSALQDRYLTLLPMARANGITCTAIGLGSKSDCDAPLLQKIAKLGDGRCYFTNRPRDLPRLFAQDTFIVARSAFVDEPALIQKTAPLFSVTGRNFSDPPAIGGYNLTYLRDKANVAALTTDEHEAPIVAYWNAGLGRSLCYAGQANGEFTGPIGQWDEVGMLFTSLARWTAGRSNDLPDGMLVTQEVRDGACRIRLHLDPERDLPSLDLRPVVRTLRDAPLREPSTTQTAMRWLDAETLGVDIPMSGDETIASTVMFDEETALSLWPVCLPYSPEFQPESGQSGEETLEQLAKATGGEQRAELGAIWEGLPKRPRRFFLSKWALLLAATIFLAEVFERRTGLLGGTFNWLRRGMTRRRQPVAKQESAGQDAPQGDPRRKLGFLQRLRYRRALKKDTQTTGVQGPPPAPDVDTDPKKPKPEPKEQSAPGMGDALRRASKRAENRRGDGE